MLYYKNISDLFFENYPKDADELLFLSGYVGPTPIQRTIELGIKATIIYGMIKNNFQPQLHAQLLKFNESGLVDIYYPTFECHSKCYLWLRNGTPIRGLIGSANFSSNGLETDYRETLFQVDNKELYFFKSYIELIKAQSKLCNVQDTNELNIVKNQSEVCELELFSTKTGQVPLASGLNWGFGIGNVNINDAYIAIRKEHIRNFANLYPPKQPIIEDRKNANEYIEIIWDDGEVMQGLLEGSQDENGVTYPKQISSAPRKAELGIYLRRRLGVPEGVLVTTDHLTSYGRRSISVKKLEEGVYSFDFSR